MEKENKSMASQKIPQREEHADYFFNVNGIVHREFFFKVKH